MKKWFARLPVHQKLVAMALIVTTGALLAATAGLIALDVWRYRNAAAEDIVSLAQVIAENSAAALAFDDPDAATETLATTRLRPTVTRACIYRPDGSLFAAYSRPDGADVHRAASARGQLVAEVFPGSTGDAESPAARHRVRGARPVGPRIANRADRRGRVC